MTSHEIDKQSLSLGSLANYLARLYLEMLHLLPGNRGFLAGAAEQMLLLAKYNELLMDRLAKQGIVLYRFA